MRHLTDFKRISKPSLPTMHESLHSFTENICARIHLHSALCELITASLHFEITAGQCILMLLKYSVSFALIKSRCT